MSDNQLQTIAGQIASGYKNDKAVMFDTALELPDRSEVIQVIKDLQMLFFPAYYAEEDLTGLTPEAYAENLLACVRNRLCRQVARALHFSKSADAGRDCGTICGEFMSALPGIQQTLQKDLEANFEGDPAAQSREEVIFSYPGFYAIFVYRIAHILYTLRVPFIPRIMTEHAHGKTGIDINPGATIGDYFFIDHGTGIVIGETTEIGSHVKLYQGVTLGALSLRKGQALSGKKRHPTIGDNVTLYAGSTILGGETVIGNDTVIGGNSFITDSIESGSKVSPKAPEHSISKENRK